MTGEERDVIIQPGTVKAYSLRKKKMFLHLIQSSDSIMKGLPILP